MFAAQIQIHRRTSRPTGSTRLNHEAHEHDEGKAKHRNTEHTEQAKAQSKQGVKV
jgi:hypothetical protein